MSLLWRDIEDFKVSRYHGGTHPGGVVEAIDRHFKTNWRKGQVVLITHEAFDRVPYFSRSSDWTVFFDEVPSAFDAATANIPEVHRFLTKNLELSDGEKFAEVVVAKPAAIKKIWENKAKDVAYSQVKDITSRLLQDGWSVYVDRNYYVEMTGKNSSKRALETYAVRNDSKFVKFDRIIVSSAFIKESLFYHIMKACGCSFRSYDGIPNSLKAAFHKNGRLLEIHHFDFERWSKQIRDKNPEMVTDMVSYTSKLFEGNEFIWQGNADDKDHFSTVGGTRLSGSPHGLNQYRNIDNVAVLGAFNPNTQQVGFLKFMGMSSAQIDAAMNMNIAYQAIMRGSLRIQNSTTKKQVVVADRRTAKWLSRVFPGAEVKEVPVQNAGSVGKLGRPKKYENVRERVRARRARKKDDKISIEVIKSVSSEIEIDCNETTIDTISNNVTSSINEFTINISIFKSIYSSSADNNIKFDSVDAVIEFMELRSTFRRSQKEFNELFNLTETYNNNNCRSAEDVSRIHSLIFDNDGGTVSASEFGIILSDYRICITNSFSSTVSRPRWRAIIPTTRYMTPEEHEMCWNGVITRLDERGYKNGHGFDTSKRAVNSIFYLPCRAKDPNGSFFHDLKDGHRRLLNPDEWMRQYPTSSAVVISAPSAAISSRTLQPDGVEQAINHWRTVGCLPGNGDSELFRLAGALQRAGLSEGEIEKILREEALYANTTKDRLAQIPRILKGLKLHA